MVITDTGRVEQRMADLPDACEDEDVAHLRALLNASLDGRRLAEAVKIVASLGDSVPPAGRANAAAVFSSSWPTWPSGTRSGSCCRDGQPGRARLLQGLRDVLSALEEQVVLMQVLGDASDESLLSVMIGRENPVEGLQTTSLVSSGYGSGGETLAKLAVLARHGWITPGRWER